MFLAFALAVGQGLVAGQATPPAPPNVVLVMMDGVRQQEWGGRATDDAGRPVRFGDLFPVLLQFRKRGLWLPNLSISNPAGVSLPAYADIFAGRRQEKIVTNHPPAEDLRSHYPTLLQQARRQFGTGFDSVALVSSWSPLCALAASPPLVPEDDFLRSCAFKSNVPPESPPAPFFKPEVYANSRTDIDTFLEFQREIPKRHPRLVVIHLGDADEEAHLHARIERKTGQHYGIFHYHQALRQGDYLLGRIWDVLQSDPFYRDNTYLFVTTDHGRDTAEDPTQWASHGRCIAEKIRAKPCSGCSGVFGLVVGPGLVGRTARGTYRHTDLAPTIAKLLRIDLPTATGKPIREVIDPVSKTPNPRNVPWPAFLTLAPPVPKAEPPATPTQVPTPSPFSKSPVGPALKPH